MIEFNTFPLIDGTIANSHIGSKVTNSRESSGKSSICHCDHMWFSYQTLISSQGPMSTNLEDMTVRHLDGEVHTHRFNSRPPFASNNLQFHKK